jgi:LPPG:FO 2-phospho-L-lactate transferase
MLAQLGFEVSAYGVARMYQDVCATFVIDPVDSAQSSAIESLGMEVLVHPTVMRNVEDKELLARRIVQFAAKQKAGTTA